MDLKIFTDNIDWKAKEQIYTLLDQPAFQDCKVRIMPDVHAGAGCVIGFTANLGDKVIPNIVGVDIGCGMRVVDLGKIDIDYERLDKNIRECIPYGRAVHEPQNNYKLTRAMKTKMGRVVLNRLHCHHSLKNTDWIMASMGTLGGGNHFIEIDEDATGNKYLVIHSGSRNLGKQVAEIYQQIAIDKMIGNGLIRSQIQDMIAEYKRTGREREIEDAIKKSRAALVPCKIPKDLCYLTGDDRRDYLDDMTFCQTFARDNREAMAEYICFLMGWAPIDSFESIHNYIDMSDNIVRKGAISAKIGQRVIIPINMRDGCILGVGKGNEDWNCSAPHGAGRIMSRSEAKQNISLEEYKATMSGIYTTSVSEYTIDEAPMAYKPMDEIVDNISDTVDVQHIIKPVYNFKACE